MSDLAAREPHLREAAALSSRAVSAWLAVTVVTAIWFALPAGRPLSHPDEGRYAEIPREMLLSGDWVTPRLDDLIYLEKPPLQYWTTALAYVLFGENEWSARAWTMLCGALDVVFVFLLARRLWDLRTGLIAAAILASMPLHFVMGQLLTLDMAFTAALTAMLFAFCMAQVTRESDARASGRWMLASWAMLGVAILTKGVAAPLIAGAVLVVYLIWQRDWAVMRTLRPTAGLALLAVIVLPWFVPVARANADFLQFFFIHEHLLRYTTDAARRVEPWWYFLAILAGGVLPWIWHVAGALFHGWRTDVPKGQFAADRLLWIWCAFVLLFFSLSGSKLAPYILPMLPPLALLTAARVSAAGWSRRVDIGVWMLLAFALVCCGTALLGPSVFDDPVVRSVALATRPAAITLVIVAVLAAFLFFRSEFDGRRVQALLILATGWFVGYALLFGTVGRDGSARSGRDLAAHIAAQLPPHAPLYSVQTYDQTLPFYLQRTMILVDSVGELEYGLEHEPGKGIHDMRVFEQRWQDAPQAAAFMPNRTYMELAARGLPMRVLGMDRSSVVVSRR